MSANAAETSGCNLPEILSWEELQQLPDDIAEGIELWHGRVVWNRRGPLEHQQFAVRVRNAIEADARRAMREETSGEERRCWQVGVETNVFFAPDRSSFLTPDFLVRRCLPRGADTFATDTLLVGEVLSGSDTPKRRQWKMDRYAEAAIPWYWEVELDSGRTWDITSVRAYELVTIDSTGLAVKPLRPSVYVPVGEWEPDGTGIEFPEPFALGIAWEDLAF
ncbi:Uma2 family endonuclease [Streptomyces montanisoli]|uniref:Uma2 family endonuclease n=1 Tax=Streptomyces montanisoli TaxID=2798581 RepID=A0A940MJH4_9ACTN|nr:Uma2 family endonuclease [Streptomyces montanisoli]MBP0461953.1 Uma2 family endonuclease [Streptomyces montanisoli]